MFKLLFSSLVILTFGTGCSDILGNKGSVRIDYGPDFKISKVSLKCDSETDAKDCDGSIGLLMRTEKTLTGYSTYRCTAWKPQSPNDNVVMANMHCFDGATEAHDVKLSGYYYIVPDVSGVGTKAFKIKRLIKGRRSPEGKVKGTASGLNLDYAYFELEESIPSIPSIEINPYSLADGLKVRMVSVNESDYSYDNYSFDLNTYSNCEVSSKNLRFPYELTETSTLVMLKNCPMIGGNSGSAILNGNKAVAIGWGYPSTEGVTSSDYEASLKKSGLGQLLNNTSYYHNFSLERIALASSFHCIPSLEDTSGLYLKSTCKNWIKETHYEDELEKSLARQKEAIEASLKAEDHYRFSDDGVSGHNFDWKLEERTSQKVKSNPTQNYTFAPTCKDDINDSSYKLKQKISYYLNDSFELSHNSEYERGDKVICGDGR